MNVGKQKEPRLARPVKLDGRKGEGGGQLVRIAISLAAITGTPIIIDHIRANRERRGRGGGLKAQHVTCMKYLADATNADVSNCFVGSKDIEFKAKLSPSQIVNRNIKIKSDSAGSVMLVFQALLPFLLHASDKKGTPIALSIEGGTNVGFSPSFKYIDQVLLPSLERFGINVERHLESRGWSRGSRQIGSAKFKIDPIPLGQPLSPPDWPTERGYITKIDISIIVPLAMHGSMKKAFLSELETVFPETNTDFLIVEDSRHIARLYTILVAYTSTGLRFGCDWLYDRSSKNKTSEELSTEMAKKVVSSLNFVVRKGGLVDEHLHAQLIIFQALAGGNSVIPGSAETANSSRQRIERTDRPFGDGSPHATTARWVTSQLFPNLKWVDKGRVCVGAGWTSVEVEVEAAEEAISAVRIDEPTPVLL
ncbi:hypothetical protein HYALB_00013175 [Hymenoscyphus albidus]|uniref:RNA 3'-terminal phosphate cyclase domain-containing protein n=1 Tax=Hymenoscyphus albidus TaxID=595503 RepID=A0A9N9LQV5_9HELO|nr:hypothetical protein HYALB_00013175 [Hymenoscyphus albidus]